MPSNTSRDSVRRATSLALLIVAAIMLGAFFGAASLASADHRPAHASAETFGCSLPPFTQSAKIFDFHGACVWHDLCYRRYGYGSTPGHRRNGRYPKAWCDKGFYKKMAYGGEPGTVAASTKGCRHRKLDWGLCLSAARGIYLGVKSRGKTHPTRGTWAYLFCRGGCYNVPDMPKGF